MECGLCHCKPEVLIHVRVYTPEGIQVCKACYETIDSNRHKPYSQIMDKLAIAEAGYHVNRKVARLGSR
jgi:hypothetical protein